MSGREGSFPACPKGDAPSQASGSLARSTSPPQHSEEPNNTRCPSDCASPCAWESSEGDGEQKRGLLRALLSTGFCGFSCNAPQASSQPKSQTICLCPPLGLPPRKEGLPTLKALCVGLTRRPLVRTGRLDDHGWHLNEMQGTLVVLQGLCQI